MNPKNEVIVKSSESFTLEPVGAGEGTSRSVLIGPSDAPNFALRKFVMKPSGGMPRHTNTVEHEQYILKGGAEVGIGGDVYQVKEGDVVFIPEGVPHWYKADAEVGFEFLCMVPNKEDRIDILEAGC
ncbi:cupin domain-containing protein [Pelagicoccus sp. SDUM812002]|uniref:cupin domain-containing protein n=1 Tax=Pelagicoccus sp. SDUM812002 TaxID=3041266 RepID=UPI00280DB85F|nr:cupin domain-containing protein [Pelagicoccus sp. SDUM812002]MDQ8187010.1 cupin domain-containing protein [Pelagicoccus sp. SDUM812002]